MKKRIILFLSIWIAISTTFFIGQWIGKQGRTIEIKKISQPVNVGDLVSQLDDVDRLQFVEFSMRVNDEARHKIISLVYQYAKKYNLNPFLVLALIKIESNFNPDAISIANCKGLMQINDSPNAWKDLVKGRNLFDPETNIDIGCYILRHYLDMANGDTMQALYYYCNGPNAKVNVNETYAADVMNTKAGKRAMEK